MWKSKNGKFLKLQERITTPELEKDDLEQYGRRVCVRIDDVPVESVERADSVYGKVGKILKEAWPNVPVPYIDWAYHIGSEYKSYRNKKMLHHHSSLHELNSLNNVSPKYPYVTDAFLAGE